MSIRNELTLLASKTGYYVDNKGKVYNKFGNNIKSFKNGKNAMNYLVFSIRDLSKWKYAKKVYVHKLQAYQKFGNKIFENGVHIRHLNNNSFDNSWDNIEIGTASDNNLDKYPEVRKKSATIASRKRQDSIRSFEERCLIYEDLKNKVPYSEIMKKYSISSKGTLSFMKNKSLEYINYIN